MSESTRRWMLRVLVAAGPVAAFYGWVADEAVGLWVGLGSAALGVGGQIKNRKVRQ